MRTPTSESGAAPDFGDPPPALVLDITSAIMGLGWALLPLDGDDVEIPDEYRRRHGQVQEIVAAALFKGTERARVDYTNHRGERGIRIITVLGAYWGSTEYHPEPQWLLTCYDHDKRACRVYAQRDIYAWNGIPTKNPTALAAEHLEPEPETDAGGIGDDLPTLSIRATMAVLLARLEQRSPASLVPGGQYGLAGTEGHWLALTEAAISVVRGAPAEECAAVLPSAPAASSRPLTVSDRARMKELQKLSEAATQGEWSTGGIFDPNGPRPTTSIWGPTAPGMQSGEWIAKGMLIPDANLACRLVNTYRSGLVHLASNPLTSGVRDRAREENLLTRQLEEQVGKALREKIGDAWAYGPTGTVSIRLGVEEAREILLATSAAQPAASSRQGGAVMTVVHELKTLPAYFDAVERGEKTFEIRKDDRGFQKGDVVRLRRLPDPGTRIVTGSRENLLEYMPAIDRRILWILTGGQFGVEPGYVILALGSVDVAPASQSHKPARQGQADV